MHYSDRLLGDNDVRKTLWRLAPRRSLRYRAQSLEAGREAAAHGLGRRKFSGVDYIFYFDRLKNLLMNNGALYKEFIMVSTKTGDLEVETFYVGVPDESFMTVFDGFERVQEEQLPKIIDVFHIGDQEPFRSRFRFAHNAR